MMSLLAVSLVILGTSACGDDEAVTPSLIGFRPTAEQRVDGAGMPDASNDDEVFEFRADADGLLVVSFGYTSCPDICPTTLAALRGALKQLGDDAERVDVAMATVDPARDDGDTLTGYVQSFVEGAHSLRTDDVALLREVTDSFGVSFGVETNDQGQVEVSHSSLLYVVGEDGLMKLSWPFGTNSTDMASDLRVLLGEAAA
ncbi:MAG: hypothetical protein RI958_3344 [Actinomycetota bacterium]